MGIINKKIKAVNKEPEQLNGMTYTQIVSLDLDKKMNQLLEKRKVITSGINELLGEIKTNGNNSVLAGNVAKLREAEKDNEKEINKARSTYEVDFELKCIAAELDQADKTNEGIELLYSIGPKVNDILSVLPKIERCYGGDYYSPSAYGFIKNAMLGLAGSLNNELPKLKKVNKKALLQKFNERMAVVEENKKKNQAINDKYSLENI